MFLSELSGSIPSAIGELTALTVLYVVVWFIHARAHRVHPRSLAQNVLVGSIPSTIRQLTALTTLYVLVHVAFNSSVSSRLAWQKPGLQASRQQPVVWADSVDDWRIDESRSFVRSTLLSCQLSCVGVLTSLVLRAQGAFQQRVDGPDSIDDWTIDETQFVVCCRVDYVVSELTFMPFPQEFKQEQLDGPNSIDDWTIDGPQCVVRFRYLSFVLNILYRRSPW